MAKKKTKPAKAEEIETIKLDKNKEQVSFKEEQSTRNDELTKLLWKIEKILKKQMNLEVKIKKLDERAKIPTYITDGSAGLDLTAIECDFNKNERCYVYRTGLSIEIPKGYVGLLFPKSGISKRTLHLANSVGVIDSDYRGEIVFKFKPDGYKCTKNNFFKRLLNKILGIPTITENVYIPTDKIGQLIIMPYPRIHFSETDELSETERGNRGFGEMDKQK